MSWPQGSTASYRQFCLRNLSGFNGLAVPLPLDSSIFWPMKRTCQVVLHSHCFVYFVCTDVEVTCKVNDKSEKPSDSLLLVYFFICLSYLFSLAYIACNRYICAVFSFLHICQSLNDYKVITKYWLGEAACLLMQRCWVFVFPLLCSLLCVNVCNCSAYLLLLSYVFC